MTTDADTDPRAQLGAHSHRRYWTVHRDANAIVEPPPDAESVPGAAAGYVALAVGMTLLCLTLASVALWVLPKVTP